MRLNRKGGGGEGQLTLEMSYEAEHLFEHLCCRLTTIIIIFSAVIDRMYDGRGAMVRAWRLACRSVSNPSCCRVFIEISCFFPLNIGTSSWCCVRWQSTLPHLLQLTRCKCVHGRRDMSMRRNGCTTVYYPWSWNGTRTNTTSDQGVNCKVDW